MYAQELRQKLARVASQMRALVAKAQADGNRGLTPEEASEFDRMDADYTNIENSIKRDENLERIEASLRGVDVPAAGGQLDPTRSDAAARADKHSRIFAKYLRNGMESLDQDEKKFMASTMNINNTLSTTTPNQGGYLVPQGFSGQLEEAMKWFGGAEDGVEVITTETGNPFPWPTDDDTSNTGEIVGQNVAVAEQDMAPFGQVILGSYIFSSKLVRVPLALMTDSFFPLDSYVAKKLGTRLGRIFNKKLTIGLGSGSGEPTGILTAAVAAGNVLTPATGNATAITPDNIVELEHAVDIAYRNNPSAKYMFHDSTLKALKKLKDNQLRPLWLPGLSGSLADALNGATLNGHGYIVNNDMPVMAANAYSILFGDLQKYKARKVNGDISVTRLVERYAEYLQVGFLAFMRADGNLLDAGTHPVAVYRNSAT